MGTDLWATEVKGMMSPPDFGHSLNKDRMQRVFRYLARGPAGCENELCDDPWSEVRWLVEEFNCQRRLEFKCGWAVVPDESMITWQGKSGPGGMPHLSFIARKPAPLGLELKTICDADTGIMMGMEIQEGKIRMARMRYCDRYPATTASTLRLCALVGLGENSIVGEKPHRVVFADSWFASVGTVKAVNDTFGQFSSTHFVMSTCFMTTWSPLSRFTFYRARENGSRGLPR